MQEINVNSLFMALRPESIRKGTDKNGVYSVSLADHAKHTTI